MPKGTLLLLLLWCAHLTLSHMADMQLVRRIRGETTKTPTYA